MGKKIIRNVNAYGILNAARECFAENGFHNTSMKTICKASDMSPEPCITTSCQKRP
ncbi:Bacterial regulatory proteins, tetR family [Citrobacter werkmanii]|uniref:Bacterial regulatory proteins, tetR family n=1 Tax=Citrobacter werkmanii TaxID=67827 RepID=A0ABM8N5C6_9ENTR|nr:Bacterial regulatory proteins, tetR family [Citrobacter werkmanii]